MVKTVKNVLESQRDSVAQFKESKREDYRLIDRFLLGDELGFEILVKKYQNHVINMVHSFLGKTHHIEDIAQEVFIKVYENLSSFKRKADFSTWLYRITVNTTYNYIKKEKRHTSLRLIKEKDSLKKASLENFYGKEKQLLIRKGLGKLPFKYRTIIVLKDIEGLSYKDIAKILGCRIGTVESRLFRARARLKKILSA
jgi:RNA polymerase sigma-70 factor (ECF subfamily)